MRGNLCKSRRKKNAFIIIFVIILIFNFFNIQAFADEKVTEEIKDILNKYYLEGVPQDILNTNSADEIINNLNDPYTQILSDSNYSELVDNAFDGIGVTIEMSEEGVVVDSVMINSPAMKSGLKEGDIIIAVDDYNLKKLSGSDALNIINGKLGVSSKLMVLRGTYTLLIDIIPETVYYPTVYNKIVNNNIAYFHITSFGKKTYDEFKYKIDSLDMNSIDSFIIDLRNNTGGYIYNAIQLAGYFIRNNTVAIVQNKYGAKYKFNATEKDKFIDKPTIFLVNKYTASAAELLAACFQDYKRAIIIGEATYGKGVIQETFKLSDGNLLKTTTLKLYSPYGRDINKVGISPDINIKGVDSLAAGELIAGNGNRIIYNGKTAIVKINDRDYDIDIDVIDGKNHWEAYRQIISQADSLDVSNYSLVYQNSKVVGSFPVVKYAEKPKTEYKVGEKVSFKLNSANYNGLVQYRAVLWDQSTNQYVNLWSTKDFYYDKWKPRGKDVFTISLPITEPGNYRIKVFAKRSGVANSKGVLKGMNCDSYVYEIPFKVTL